MYVKAKKFKYNFIWVLNIVYYLLCNLYTEILLHNYEDYTLIYIIILLILFIYNYYIKLKISYN